HAPADAPLSAPAHGQPGADPRVPPRSGLPGDRHRSLGLPLAFYRRTRVADRRHEERHPQRPGPGREARQGVIPSPVLPFLGPSGHFFVLRTQHRWLESNKIAQKMTRTSDPKISLLNSLKWETLMGRPIKRRSQLIEPTCIGLSGTIITSSTWP